MVTPSDGFQEHHKPARKPFPYPLPMRAGLPLAMVDFDTLPKIVFKHPGHFPGKVAVIDFLVGIEIPALVPAVQITGTDGAPVIAKLDLGMRETLLVFENSDSVTQ